MIAGFGRRNTGAADRRESTNLSVDDAASAKRAMGGHDTKNGLAHSTRWRLSSRLATNRRRSVGVANRLDTGVAMTEINRSATGEYSDLGYARPIGGMANMPFPPGLKQLRSSPMAAKLGVRCERLQDAHSACGIGRRHILPKSGDDFARDLASNRGGGETSLSDQPQQQIPGMSLVSLLRRLSTPGRRGGLNLILRSIGQSAIMCSKAPDWTAYDGPYHAIQTL